MHSKVYIEQISTNKLRDISERRGFGFGLGGSEMKEKQASHQVGRQWRWEARRAEHVAQISRIVCAHGVR